MTEGAHRWFMTNVRDGYLVVEGCPECGARSSFFSTEPVPPVDEYHDGRHFWIYLGSRFCSATAMTLLRAAIAWHVFELSNSAFHLGLIGLDLLPASLSLRHLDIRLGDAKGREERLHAGGMWTDRGLVFCGYVGRPLSPANVTHGFQIALARLGLPRLRRSGPSDRQGSRSAKWRC